METAVPIGAVAGIRARTGASDSDSENRDVVPGACFGDEATLAFPHELKKTINPRIAETATTTPTAAENGPRLFPLTGIRHCWAIISLHSLRPDEDSFIALIPPALGLCEIVFRLGLLAYLTVG